MARRSFPSTSGAGVRPDDRAGKVARRRSGKGTGSVALLLAVTVLAGGLGTPASAQPSSSHLKGSALSGAKLFAWSFEDPEAMVMAGPDLFVANFEGRSVTEVNALTGALVRVLSHPEYDFDGPQAMVMAGPDLFVANFYGNSVTELDASTGALVRVLSGSRYDFNEPRAIVLDGPDIFVADGAADQEERRRWGRGDRGEHLDRGAGQAAVSLAVPVQLASRHDP